MDNENKQKENKKSSKTYYIIAGIVLLMAIVVTSIFLINSKKENEDKIISYTDLIKQIDEGKIEKVEMTVGSTSIKVKLKDIEEEKGAIVQNTQAFIELIQEKTLQGNAIELIQKQQNVFYTAFQYLFSLLPTILLLVLFVAVFKMQGLGDKGKVYDAETTKSKIKFNDVAGIYEYAKVKSIKLYKRKECIELDDTRGKGEEEYLRFELDDFRNINSIKPMEIGIRTHWYTTFYLLNNATNIHELKFKSNFEMKVYRKLEKIAKEMNVAIKMKTDGYEINGKLVVIDEESVKIDNEKASFGSSSNCRCSSRFYWLFYRKCCSKQGQAFGILQQTAFKSNNW